MLAKNTSERGVSTMLVLTRKPNQSIIIGDDIEVTVVETQGEQVRLGITAPKEIPIYRREIYEEIHHSASGKGARSAIGQRLGTAPAFAQPGAFTTVGED